MNDETMVTPPDDNQNEVKGIKIVPDKEKKFPLNKILICLILIVFINAHYFTIIFTME